MPTLTLPAVAGLICIDPGVKACGVARFRGEVLVDAFYGQLSEVDFYGHYLVVEMPRIYPGSGQQKGDLNDLLDLAAIVGQAEAMAARSERVFPARWKGQVPKKIMTARIFSKLSPAERACIEHVGAKDHNTLDAVGIGLWRIGRL